MESASAAVEAATSVFESMVSIRIIWQGKSSGIAKKPWRLLLRREGQCDTLKP
jgi:hypothetical protein